MGSKFKKNLSDIVLVGVIIGLGILVLYLARTSLQPETPDSFGGVTGQRGGLTQTNPVTATVTLEAVPTTDPEAPTFDDPEMAHPTPSGPGRIIPTPRPEDPFHLSACAERETSLSGFVPYSDSIIIGTVNEVLPSRWTTPDGKRPANPFEAGVDSMVKYGIVTQINVTIEQYVRGVTEERQIRVVLNSGKVGDDSVDQCGATDFEDFRVGQRVLLFLSGKGKYRLDTQAWLLGGRFTIDTNRIASNQQQQLPLDQLLKQIEAIPRFSTPTPQL